MESVLFYNARISQRPSGSRSQTLATLELHLCPVSSVLSSRELFIPRGRESFKYKGHVQSYLFEINTIFLQQFSFPRTVKKRSSLPWKYLFMEAMVHFLEFSNELQQLAVLWTTFQNKLFLFVTNVLVLTAAERHECISNSLIKWPCR